jgi:hypothetical protein
LGCEYYYEKQVGVSPEKYSWNEMLNDPRQPYWQEEKEKYGFDERETWGLCYTFVTWIYPRLKYFREISNRSRPMDLTQSQWDEILDEMLSGFEIYLITDNSWNQEVLNKMDKSLELFKKYFWGLWW